MRLSNFQSMGLLVYRKAARVKSKLVNKLTFDRFLFLTDFWLEILWYNAKHPSREKSVNYRGVNYRDATVFYCLILLSENHSDYPCWYTGLLILQILLMFRSLAIREFTGLRRKKPSVPLPEASPAWCLTTLSRQTTKQSAPTQFMRSSTLPPQQSV